MSAELAAAKLAARLAAMERRLKSLDRRLNNILREGKITDIDFEAGTAVMEAGGVETPMAPWITRAGSVRDWNPPTSGERAIFISPSGDPSQGMILPGGFSSEFPSNSKDAASPRRNIGRYSVTETEGGIVWVVGSTTMEFSEAGLFVTVGGSTYQLTEDGLTNTAGGATFRFNGSGFSQDGGEQRHNGTDVGSTHTHSGIQRGGSRTNDPS